jgi:tetratricopeptide (TPR) repeat protein
MIVPVYLALAPGAVLAQRHAGSREQKILQIQDLIENHNLAGAAALLAEAKGEFPSDEGFENLRGIVEAQQGDYAAAEKSFSEAIHRSPRFTGAYLNLGRLYQENATNDPQAPHKALDVYDRVLRYEPDNVEANYQAAVLLLREARYRDSLGHAARLPAKVQHTAQSLAVLCGDYAGLGDRKNADAAAARLAASEDFSEADAQQAVPVLAASKRDDLAISLLEQLQTRQALSPNLERALGLAYERTGKLPEARAALEKSVTKETLSVALLLDLARIAHKQRDYQGSLGYLAHARDIEPGNATVHYYFGLVCVDLNLVAEARNSFEKAVNLEPDNASYNYAMGATSAFRHDPAEAVPYFEKYLKLKPGDPRAKLALGDALFRARDYEAALPWLREAAKTTETSATAHYYLGSIALEERRLEEAFSELKRAIQSKPDYADALAELGQYYLVQKDYSQAEKQIREALRIDPDHFSGNFYLLTLYTRTGDSRREAQAKRFDELQKLRDEKTQEFLRIVEVRPFEAP